MSSLTLQNLGDAIFGDIDNNPFLNELYGNILYNYAITKFNLSNRRQMREIDVISALRFADLLSKSTHAVNRDKHKMWAQEIIILLHALFPDDPNIKFYAGSVFANTGNYQARKIIESDFNGTAALERFFAEYQSDYLTILQHQNFGSLAHRKMPTIIFRIITSAILARHLWGNPSS